MGSSREILTAELLEIAADLAACERDEGIPGPLAAIKSLVGADALCCGEFRRGRGGKPPRLEFGPGTDAAVYEPVVVSALTRHWRQNPALVQHLRRPLATATKMTDFLTASQWRRRALFRDGYRAAGLRYEIAVQLSRDREGTAALVMHRAGNDFGERERGLLDAVAPHLRAARERIAARAVADRRRALLERGLTLGGEELVVLDGEDRLLGASSGAPALLAAWFGTAPAGRLPAELAEWRRARRGATRPATLLRRRGGRRLGLRLMPGENEDLLLLRERGDGPPDPAELRRALPLSEREAEVLAWLAAGESNAAIAHRLGISPHTAARHVESIYRKLDVPNRAAAAARAVQIGGEGRLGASGP